LVSWLVIHAVGYLGQGIGWTQDNTCTHTDVYPCRKWHFHRRLWSMSTYRAWIICNTRRGRKLMCIDRADRRVDLKSLLLRLQEAREWNLSPKTGRSDW